MVNTTIELKKQYICPQLRYGLLQNIRFVHALMESDYGIYIPKEESEKFILLKKFFKVDFVDECDDFMILQDIVYDHAVPTTSIGFIKRPLIFPHAMFHYCRSLWRVRRPIKFLFVGLQTSKRKVVLFDWLDRYKFDMVLQNTNPILKIYNDIFGFFQRKDVVQYKTSMGKIVFIFSDRGRVFPIKTFDKDYFAALSSSQFALCPNGDFVWSYRFFEAIMCGVIPIVEEICEAYDGFRFKRMDENPRDFIYSIEDAEYNFSLCRERLTVPIGTLNEQISRILSVNNTYIPRV